MAPLPFLPGTLPTIVALYQSLVQTVACAGDSFEGREPQNLFYFTSVLITDSEPQSSTTPSTSAPKMAYLFYTFVFLFLVVATGNYISTRIYCHTISNTASALYATRNVWKPYAPPIPYLTAPGEIPDWAYNIYDRIMAYIDRWRYSALPSSFQNEAEQGFHSSNFDIAENIEGEDSRSGLSGQQKAEIYGIMRRQGVTFDEARRLYTERQFAAAGIGPDGRPLDRKAVVFS